MPFERIGMEMLPLHRSVLIEFKVCIRSMVMAALGLLLPVELHQTKAARDQNSQDKIHSEATKYHLLSIKTISETSVMKYTQIFVLL